MFDEDASRPVDEPERWIGLRRPARAPLMRLIAFPYAGGGASVYRRWLSDLAHEDWLDFVAVQLPGRERRISEPALTELSPLLGKLEWALSSLTNLPCVLFGYSMGAVFAYELALRLVGRGVLPRLLILAARTPPYFGKARAPRGAMQRDELIARVRRLGGTAPGLIDSSLFDDYFLPTLRADFGLVDTHHREVPQILPCPLLAFGARDDPEVTVEQIMAWGAAGRSFELKLFDGGHFFLHNAHEEVLRVVNAVIGNCMTGERAGGETPHADRRP
jgi:medium-chain acyl-[acyl-carrier-protein] hydrolase